MLKEAFEKYGKEFVVSLAGYMQDSVASGKLINSLQPDLVSAVQILHLDILADESFKYPNFGQSGSESAPAGVEFRPNRKRAIEKTGNGWDVVKPLKDWAESKGRNPWAVESKIFRFGSEPKHWLEDAIKEMEPKLAKLMEEAAVEEFVTQIDSIIEKTKN
jgi:hypothetical protein